MSPVVIIEYDYIYAMRTPYHSRMQVKQCLYYLEFLEKDKKGQ